MREVQAAGGAALNDADPAPAKASPPAGRRRPFGLLALIAVLAFGSDLVTKTIVLANVREPVPVLDGLLTIRLTFNSGAAFSIGTGMTWVFSIIAVIVVAAILRFARNLRSKAWAVTLGLLLGGALGNLVDRIFRPPAPFHGHVVDWIELPYWPVFNLADSAIVCGGALAVLLAWRGIGVDGTRERKAREERGG